jgi:UDP-N-acetylmuramate: L-alanyl-gamma-D-glutamyl-meso-diaminopimelate ligase
MHAGQRSVNLRSHASRKTVPKAQLFAMVVWEAGLPEANFAIEMRVTLNTIHIIGICGRFTANLAIILAGKGARVTGSDDASYGAAADALARVGIPVMEGWNAQAIHPAVDLVIVGSMIRRGNAELESALSLGIPVCNAAAFLEKYLLGESENFVITGTKGKTTTTAMLTSILEGAGRKPNYLIGGNVIGLEHSMRFDESELAVLEGDEYVCGFGDPFPKFLRYRPRHVVITNIAHEHPDVYPTLFTYISTFQRLLEVIPPDGSLILNADDQRTAARRFFAHCRVQRVGFASDSDLRITGYRTTRAGLQFKLAGQKFALPMAGRMNATNAALAAVAAMQAGVTLEESAMALRSYAGVSGRMELLSKAGNLLIYRDEAANPIAITALLEAAKARHPDRRILVVFEPHNTGGGEGVCQREMPAALAAADLAIIAPDAGPQQGETAFDHKRLCRDINRSGGNAHAASSNEALKQCLAKHATEGDVIFISLAMNHDSLRKEMVRLLESKSGTPRRA